MTQFRRPNGAPRTVTVDRPPEIEAMAYELLRDAYAFEVEVLRDGTVSLEVVGPEDDNGDRFVLAGHLAPNDEWLAAAVDQLVRDAHEAWRIVRTPIEA